VPGSPPSVFDSHAGGPVGDLPQPGHLLEEGVDLVPIRVAVGRHLSCISIDRTGDEFARRHAPAEVIALPLGREHQRT